MYTCSYDGILGIMSAMAFSFIRLLHSDRKCDTIILEQHLRYEISAENERKEK